MKKKLTNKILLLVILLIIFWSCSNSDVKKSENFDIQKSVIKYYNHEGFQFYIKKIHGLDSPYEACIHLNSNDANYYLFETNHLEDISQENDSIFSRPYYSYGNCLQCSGLEIIFIKDSLIYLGRVGDYDDIDGDSIKELYILVESGGSGLPHAKMTVEKVEIQISENGKSLVYPGPYNEF
jgi:hypothetical protein